MSEDCIEGPSIAKRIDWYLLNSSLFLHHRNVFKSNLLFPLLRNLLNRGAVSCY